MAKPPPLLERGELAEQGPPEAVRLPIDLIDPNALNPRRQLSEVEDLAQSIRQFGLLQPITVRRAGERYELLGGHRRRAAFLLLAEAEPFNVSWKTMPAVIRTFDDETAYLALLAGQLQSRNWAPKEEAAALERLADTRTLKEVGVLVHKNESWVSKRLRLYNDVILSAYVQTKKLRPAVAEEFISVKEAEVKRDLAERAVAEGWGQVEARAAVRRLKSSKMVSQIGKLAADLLDALSLVQPQDLPPPTAKTLFTLRGRIIALARGAPVLPTIGEAEKVAGISNKPGRRRKPAGYRPGYKPKL